MTIVFNKMVEINYLLNYSITQLLTITYYFTEICWRVTTAGTFLTAYGGDSFVISSFIISYLISYDISWYHMILHVICILIRVWRVGLFDFGASSGWVWPKSSGFGSGSGIGCTWLYWAVLVLDCTGQYWAVVGLVWWVFRWFMRHIFL